MEVFLKNASRALWEKHTNITARLAEEINQTLKKEIEEMGWLVFSQPVEPVKNAAEVLEKLAGRFPLILPREEIQRCSRSGSSKAD